MTGRLNAESGIPPDFPTDATRASDISREPALDGFNII
jgi:hypothetical protein